MNANSPQSPFDVEELKFLALKAMRTDRDEDALRLLKEANARSPENGELLYLLGMAHSNLGMVDRAIVEITQALALAPNLTNARFQLGLMQFTQRDFEKSAAVWKPLLGALAEDDPLRIFAIGLTQVGRDDLQAAIVTLERGIGLCRNEHLNEDMRRIAAEARRYLTEAKNAGPASDAGAAKTTAATQQHLLLSGYTKSPN